jgi:hypothetical protein
MASLQEGAAHTSAAPHSPLRQSLDCWQSAPSGQGLQSGPPQSRPVSFWFCTPSLQVVATGHMPESQSVPEGPASRGLLALASGPTTSLLRSSGRTSYPNRAQPGTARQDAAIVNTPRSPQVERDLRGRVDVHPTTVPTAASRASISPRGPRVVDGLGGTAGQHLRRSRPIANPAVPLWRQVTDYQGTGAICGLTPVAADPKPSRGAQGTSGEDSTVSLHSAASEGIGRLEWAAP